MTTINQLHISISQMDSDKLIQFIRDRRAFRRELRPKPIRKTSKAKPRKKNPTIKSVQNALDAMKGREEELLKLLLARRKNDSKEI